MAAQRRGQLRRTSWALEDLRTARIHRAQAGEEMVAQLDVLGVGASILPHDQATTAMAA